MSSSSRFNTIWIILFSCKSSSFNNIIHSQIRPTSPHSTVSSSFIIWINCCITFYKLFNREISHLFVCKKILRFNISNSTESPTSTNCSLVFDGTNSFWISPIKRFWKFYLWIRLSVAIGIMYWSFLGR